VTYTSGFNSYYGYGRINANAALQRITAAPTGVDLLAATDTGSSSYDNITNRDNSSAAKNLQFSVTGTIAGATISIYSDGTFIGSQVATGTTTTVTTNGSVDLPDGVRSITARQTGVGLFESGNSPALNVTIDTTIVATIVDVSLIRIGAGQPDDHLIWAAL